MQGIRANKDQLSSLGVSKIRFYLLNGFVVLLLFGSLFDLAFDAEHWPFSQYPMYSRLQTEYSYSSLRLYGVPQGEPHSEVPLHSYDYTEPFGTFRLEVGLRRLSQGFPGTEPKTERQRLKKESQRLILDEALLDILNRYEKLRLAGRHGGPPLQSVRLYEQQWQIDARAKNVEQPDHRELIAEVEQP